VASQLISDVTARLFTRLRTCLWGSWGSRRGIRKRRKTLLCWTRHRSPGTWLESESPPGSGAGWPGEWRWNTRPGSDPIKHSIFNVICTYLFNIFWRNQRVDLAKIKIILNINLNSKTKPLPRVSQCVSIDGLESPPPPGWRVPIAGVG
jgi:hypothetical protein